MNNAFRIVLLAGSAVAVLATGAAQARTCRPEDYGAVHDGKTPDTAAIQKAIDACGAGDQIELTAGVYVSGPLTLSSGDTFVVAKGATLLGTPDHTAYQGPSGPRMVPLISAHDAKDITLTGEGTIDGNGESWWSGFKAAKAAGTDASYQRPYMIVLQRVENLKVTKLTLQNSPMFHLVPGQSRNVLIDGVTIHAPADSPNTDGIDPSGHDMVFQNLTIDVGDDDIAIKDDHQKTQTGPASTNMTIRDCTFLHGHGLSIGSGTSGGVQNILAENVTFNGTLWGLRIKTGRDRGGLVRAVTYRNIKMENVRQAILITSYYPGIPATDTAQPVGPKTPDIGDITFDHVTASSADTAGGLYGLPERPLHDIRLNDVTINAGKGLVVRNASATLKGHIEAKTGPAIIRKENGTLTETP